MLSGPSGSESWSPGVYAKCSLSSIVSASGSRNQTCPSCCGGAAVGGAREGGDEVRAAVAPPHALELAAARDRLRVGLLARRDGLRVAIGDGDPLDPVRRPRRRRDGEVRHERPRARRGAHRLQRARVVGERAERAGAERQRLVGRGPAVQQAVRVARVLRVVDAGALRLDHARLVRVAAERLDRLGVAVLRLVVRIDLEHVAVRHGGRRRRLGLLAGQPGLPRRPAAGAVVERARERDVLAHAVAVLVDLDVGRAAAHRGVVGEAGDARDRVGVAAADLVVVDQHAAVAAAAHERGRAVGIARRRLAALELRHARLGDDRVAEALGEREQPLRVGDQRAVAGRASGAVGGRGGAEEAVQAAGQRDAETGGRRGSRTLRREMPRSAAMSFGAVMVRRRLSARTPARVTVV